MTVNADIKVMGGYVIADFIASFSNRYWDNHVSVIFLGERKEFNQGASAGNIKNTVRFDEPKRAGTYPLRFEWNETDSRGAHNLGSANFSVVIKPFIDTTKAPSEIVPSPNPTIGIFKITDAIKEVEPQKTNSNFLLIVVGVLSVIGTLVFLKLKKLV